MDWFPDNIGWYDAPMKYQNEGTYLKNNTSNLNPGICPVALAMCNLSLSYEVLFGPGIYLSAAFCMLFLCKYSIWILK